VRSRSHAARRSVHRCPHVHRQVSGMHDCRTRTDSRSDVVWWDAHSGPTAVHLEREPRLCVEFERGRVNTPTEAQRENRPQATNDNKQREEKHTV
jgi:hypothetical protein